MTPILHQLLFPQRLFVRALDDVHRIASAIESLRDQAAGVRVAVEPMTGDLKTLRDEFGRADDEIAALREAFGPELEAFRVAAQGILDEVRAMRRSINALVQDADEISDVVEPLQSATERVGRVAERLPGGRRRG